MIEEIWKEIPLVASKYSVSNLGRVKVNKTVILRNNGRKQTINEKIITPILNSSGYYKVRLKKEDGKHLNKSVHSLVMLCFKGDRPKGFHINHINGNKLDNTLNNLEYCTPRENIRHAWNVGLSSSDRYKKQLIWAGVIYNSVKECSKVIGIDRNTISRCLNKGYYIDRKYKLIYDSVEYSSVSEASRILNKNAKTISKYGMLIKPEKVTVKWITI